MSGKKKELRTYKDIEFSIKTTNRVKYLEMMIVELIEWRERYPRTDNQYHESRDLLEYAFDKYNDLINGTPRKEESGFCGFLKEV